MYNSIYASATPTLMQFNLTQTMWGISSGSSLTLGKKYSNLWSSWNHILLLFNGITIQHDEQTWLVLSENSTCLSVF